MRNETNGKVLDLETGAILIAACLAACRMDSVPSSARATPEASTTVLDSVVQSPDARAEKDCDAGARAGIAADAQDRGASWETLYVTRQPVIVRAERRTSAPTLGSARAGGFLLGRAEPATADCASGWYALQPFGFLCRSSSISTDATAPAVRILTEYGLAPAAALPFQCGVSVETPVYLRLPSPEEQARSEPDLQRRAGTLARPRTSEDGGAGAGGGMGHVSREMPKDLQSGSFSPLSPAPVIPGSPVTGVLPTGSRVAWIADFETNDRGWLVTPDLLLVPADRVRPAVISGFHGVELTDDVGVAFVGTRGIRKYARGPDGKQWIARAEGWPGEAAVFLAAPTRAQSEEKYLETVEKGVYIRSDQAIVAYARPPGEWGIEPSAAWIDVDARRGVLFLRRGPATLYATLVSVGNKGVARGRFRVVSKHLTLAAPFDHQHAHTPAAEVPEVILASSAGSGSGTEESVVSLYAAWWQYTWGTPNNASGIALAPLDARRVFDWVEPHLPDGWHSVSGAGNWIVVHD